MEPLKLSAIAHLFTARYPISLGGFKAVHMTALLSYNIPELSSLCFKDVHLTLLSYFSSRIRNLMLGYLMNCVLLTGYKKVFWLKIKCKLFMYSVTQNIS